MDFIILHLLLWITIIITLNHCFMADGVTINYIRDLFNLHIVRAE
jgi:hypothetical protein